VSTAELAARTASGGGEEDRPLPDIRTLGPWYLAEFLCSYAATLFTVGCYDYATDFLKASPSSRLWLSAGWGLAYIPIALLAGKISEKWGPRLAVLVMTTACVATCSLALAALAVPMIWMLALVMLPYNYTSTTIWPAIESALTRTPGKMRLSTRMALFNLSWGSAGFAAFFTHGALERVWWGTIFAVPAISCGCAALVTWKWGIPASMMGREHVPDDEGGEHELEVPGMRRRAEAMLKMAWVGNALAYTAIYVLIPVMTKLAQMASPLAARNLAIAGFITATWSFMRFAGFATMWKWSGWHYKVRYLMGAQTALALSFLGMLLIHNLAVIIALQVVFGFSVALIYSSSLYYAMHVSSGHGGHAGIHEAVIGTGVMLGPTIGALAGTGELGVGAMQRIGLGVTTVLVLGIGVQGWLALKMRTPHSEKLKGDADGIAAPSGTGGVP